MIKDQVFRNAVVPVVAWGLVFVCWMIVSRHNHPTLALNGIATFVLVGCSAIGVLFWKHAFAGREYIARTALRVTGVIALGTVAAVVIRFFYDMILGPDPRRFSFSANLVMDITFVAVHVLGARLMARVWKRWA